MIDRSEVIISRVLEDGRVLDLWPLTLNRVRLTISRDADADGYLEGW